MPQYTIHQNNVRYEVLGKNKTIYIVCLLITTLTARDLVSNYGQVTL